MAHPPGHPSRAAGRAAGHGVRRALRQTLGAAVAGLRRVGRAAVDFCFPNLCRACGAGCAGGEPLCPPCLERLARLEAAPACERCALPLGYADAPCPHCGGSGPAHFERVARLAPFDEPLRGMIHAIKYRRAWPLAEQLADRLLATEPAKALLSEAGVLVAVPLHRLRQVGRGFNQAEVVAARLARRCGLCLARPVLRLRNTETQTVLHTRHHREANLRGAFALRDARAVAGRHVVVVDDVWTTGATLHAVARVLAEAKPASLSALVLAVTAPRGMAGPGDGDGGAGEVTEFT